MNRVNRYARDGSVLSLLPNPLTRVDLDQPLSRSEGPKPPPPPAGPPGTPTTPSVKP